jgi:hypothetical protein
MMVTRVRTLSLAWAKKDEIRSRREGFSEGTKAMEKPCVERGEEGVTIMAGKGDLSGTRGRVRSDARVSDDGNIGEE